MRPFALGPPRPEVAVLVDATSGELPALEPPDFPTELSQPKQRDEPLRFRAEVMEPDADFDRTDYELPLPPPGAPPDPRQGELFGHEFSQPDANDGEPVLWSAGSAQASPDDDFVQADTAESM